MDKLTHLAVNVLGYKLDETRTPSVYIKNESGATLTVSNFKPRYKLSQAISLIEKFRFRSMTWIDGVNLWQVEVGNSLGELYLSRRGSLEKAITEAVEQASGYCNE